MQNKGQKSPISAENVDWTMKAKQLIQAVYDAAWEWMTKS